MAYKEGQTGSLPFLSQSPPFAWALVVEATPEQGILNLTAQLQEITTRRHRLYFIRCTLWLHARHYHLRIAGLLPARNKMLGPSQAIDPPCYRVSTIPKLLQEATAQLSDATKVYPLQSGQETAFLSLSGILFVGSTAEQRYVLHEHLKKLGLAGPPAPVLHWEGHFQEGPHNTHVLPFRSLSVLPAELLAIPVPTTSWAFEEMPVMSFMEWDAYRQRSTSTVFPAPTESKMFYASRVFIKRAKEFFSTLFSVWHVVCLLLSHPPQWTLSAYPPMSAAPRQPAVLPLCDQAWWTTPAQQEALNRSSSRSSARSSSTELRASPSTVRDTWCKFWCLLQVEHRRLTANAGATSNRVCRPTVIFSTSTDAMWAGCPGHH